MARGDEAMKKWDGSPVPGEFYKFKGLPGTAKIAAVRRIKWANVHLLIFMRALGDGSKYIYLPVDHASNSWIEEMPALLDLLRVRGVRVGDRVELYDGVVLVGKVEIDK
jgi:hypothetical protein